MDDKFEGIRFFLTSVTVYQATQPNIKDDLNLPQNHSETLKSRGNQMI